MDQSARDSSLSTPLLKSFDDAVRAALADTSSTLAEALGKAGVLAVDGDPGLLEVAVDEALGRDRTLLRLSLDGYEPDLPDLLSFAAYRATVAGSSDGGQAGDESPTSSLASSLVAALGAGPADGAEAAACLELALAGVEGLDLDEQLRSLERPVVLVPRADELPLTLVARLLEARPANATVVLGTGSVRGRLADARHELQAPSEESALEQQALTTLGEAMKGAPPAAQFALEALALLGGRGPLEPLLSLLVDAEGRPLAADGRDEVIDFFDDVLVDELGVLDDYEYLHPSFREACYGLAHPALPAALRRRIVDAPRRAAMLHDALAQRLPPSRGVVATLHRLTLEASKTALGTADQADAGVLGHRARLGLWIARDEAPRLPRTVDRVRDGIDPREPWLAAAAPFWQGGRRLAALDALAALGGAEAEARALDALLLGADLQLGAGSATGALAATERARALALERHGAGHPEHVRTLLAGARVALGATETAPDLSAQANPSELGTTGPVADPRALLDEALAQLDALPADSPARAVAHALDAELFLRRGELRAARPPLEAAVEAAEAAHGAGHRRVAEHRRRLAGLLVEIGELDEALTVHEQIVEAYDPSPETGSVDGAPTDVPSTDGAETTTRRVLDPNAPIARHELAVVLRELGRPADARAHSERALALADALWAGDQPAHLPLLRLLGELRAATGAVDEARTVLERGRRVAAETRGPDHPDTAAFIERLATL